MDTKRRSYDIYDIEERVHNLESGGAPTPGASITFEVVHESGVTLVDNTNHTINVTKKYTNPYVFKSNALPQSKWGGVISVSDIVYDSTTDSITFNYHSNDNTLPNGQKYDIDWFVIDLPVTSVSPTKSTKRSKK